MEEFKAVGHLLSAPWMSRFDRDAEKTFTYVEAFHQVNAVIITSQQWHQNPFLTAQSTQIKLVISVPIKDFIHHYPKALFNDIPMVGAHFYDISGSGRTFTTYPGRGAV